MKSSRFIFFVMIGLGFAFLITQQRLESHEYNRKIMKLNKDIELINSQKREVHFLIQREMQRLTLNSLQEVGQPISVQDIVSVDLQPIGSQNIASETNSSPVDHALTRLFAWSKQVK